MISTTEAISIARSMLGIPYGTLDCINFIKAIIRRSSGGDPAYTVAHVPALWNSYNSSGKYKQLIWRQKSIQNPEPGMLAFKGQPLGRDHQPSHVGLVTSPTTVIHSSSAKGCVVETDLLNGQWTLLAKHKLIAVSASPEREEEMDVLYKAKVVTESGNLNLRQGPGTSYGHIGSVERGSEVDVLKELSSGWNFISCDAGMGYVSAKFLQRSGDPTPEPVPEPVSEWLENMTLVSEAGSSIILPGRWRVAND